MADVDDTVEVPDSGAVGDGLQQFRPAHVVRRDADLVERLRAGDEEAFRRLYQRFVGPVFVIASSRASRAPEAGPDGEIGPDDITEAVFLRAYEDVDSTEAADDPASWLASITRDVCARLEPGSSDPPVPLTLDLDQIETAWTVRAAIESLDPIDRSVARSRQLDAETDVEVAEHLQLDVESVEVCAERAGRRLGRLLAHLDDAVTAHLHERRSVAALLADPVMWADPPDRLEDRVLHAVRDRSTSTMAVLSVTASAGPETENVSPVSAQRSARSWIRPAAAGAAASLLLLFIGLVVFSALSGVDETDTFTVELVSTGSVIDAGGSIDVTTVASGIRVDVDVFGLPRRDAGRFYEGWFRMADGSMVSAGTFLEGGEFTLLGGVELDSADEFVITSESIAPFDGDVDGQQSSGDVLLRNRLQR